MVGMYLECLFYMHFLFFLSCFKLKWKNNLAWQKPATPVGGSERPNVQYKVIGHASPKHTRQVGYCLSSLIILLVTFHHNYSIVSAVTYKENMTKQSSILFRREVHLTVLAK